MTTITYEDAKRTLEELAAERPDYKYVAPTDFGCAYVNQDGSPSCIVGHVLARLAPDALTALVKKGYDVGASVSTLVEDGQVALDDPTIHLLTVVQSAQDGGVPWGEAVDGAIRAAEAVR